MNLQQLRLLVLFFLIFNQIIFAQCPKLTGVMIDACGASEGINEYFVLNSGVGIADITALNIRYGTTNTFATSLVLNASVPNFWVTNASYLANLNAQITVPGCICQAAGLNIAANKNIVVLSSTVGFNAYNLSALCAADANVIPILFFDPTQTTGTGAIAGFNNTGNFGNYQNVSQNRFFEFTIDGQASCDMLINYDRSLLVKSDGTNGQENGSSITIESNGTISYNNTGCTVPALPLPVQWGELQLIEEKHATKVIWQTLAEINNKSFYVLKGESPQNMHIIGEVIAIGNTEKITDYDFLDNNKLNGTYFYQIKQEDINGNHSFSNIIATYPQNNTFIITNYYYNDKENFTFEINSPNNNVLKIAIFDIQGRSLFEKSDIITEKGKNKINIPFPFAKNGYYFYYMYDEMGNASKGMLSGFIY